jgi:hypothetical protein
MMTGSTPSNNHPQLETPVLPATHSDTLYIRHHPHPRADQKDTIISLEAVSPAPDTTSETNLKPAPSLDPILSPWFPFKNRSEYEVTRIGVQGGLDKGFLNELLAGVTNTKVDLLGSRPGYQAPFQWFQGHSEITFTGHQDVINAANKSAEYLQEVSRLGQTSE